MSGESPIAALLASVPRGEPEVAALEVLGDPDPPRSAEALVRAARHPLLSEHVGRWLAPLVEMPNPGAGARALLDLAERAQFAGVVLDKRALPSVARVVGASPALARLLARHPEWCDDLVGDPPPAPEPRVPDADWAAIRETKYRGLLRVAARDLAGRSTEQGLRELSDLADACLEAALSAAVREQGGEPPALFALGKLGGRELNFSSDVDLLFLYDVPDGADEARLKKRTADLIRSFKTGLEARTEEGFGYRVDLDLRPEGRSGTLANSVDAALSYYESFGAEWERQMLIRLRPLAGPRETREAFVREITPFVYRSLIDPGAIGSVREMKLRIESERRGAGVDLEADLKEGPGGIRDVEFLVQALQLLLGGREPALRTGNVLDALSALERAGALERTVVASLRDAYLWLRRAEHALQMAEERQTHAFPRTPAGQLELARRMGYRDAQAERARGRLLGDWTQVRAEVRGHFEALVLRPLEPSDARRAQPARFAAPLAGTPLEPLFAQAEPLFERRSQRLEGLELSAEVERGLARLLASNAELARYLARRPDALDALVSGQTLRARAGGLPSRAPVGFEEDLEHFVDGLRFFRSDEMVWAACLDLGSVEPFSEVSRFLAVLAEAVVARALEAARSTLPDAGALDFSVLGFGKLAGRELSYHSDLDLIFLYEGDDGAAFAAAKLAQRMIHYLSASTAAGAAYAIDARLRPSGGQGSLVTTYDAFQRYQLERAHTWEHLAVMRCRAVAGDVERAGAALRSVQDAIRARREAPWSEVARMRERVAAERTREDESRIAIKTGGGGLMDVDFLAAGAQLEAGAEQTAPEEPSVLALLRGVVGESAAAPVLDAYWLLRVVEARGRWLAGRAVESVDADSPSFAVLAELVEPGLDPAGLRARIDAARSAVRGACERVLEAGAISALAG